MQDEVENVRNVPENIDEDDHDENQEIFAFDENMHENGHDENQENEANQNVLNVIVQEEFLKQETDDDDNYEMNNAMIVEDIVDKLNPGTPTLLICSMNNDDDDDEACLELRDLRPDFDIPYCIDNLNFCYVYIFCDE